MTSKKSYWKNQIEKFIDLVRNVKNKKPAKILNTSFQVFPGVFSPIYSSDTTWFAEKIVPLTKGKSFLEIGSGIGAIACLASINAASTVVATDINPNAIENITANAKLHALNISIRKGSIFEPIFKGELFDIIFWNHPFYYFEGKSSVFDMIESSVFDLKYQHLKKFFQDGKNHLAKNGRLILGTSNVARLSMIKKMAKDESYRITLLEKTDVPVFKGEKLKMDLRIYEFKAKI